MNEAEVRTHLAQRLPSFSKGFDLIILRGGLMNQVWRARSDHRSIIVKHAPPYIASAPDIPLNPGRITFEAICLEMLGPGGSMERVSEEHIRPPSFIDYDEDKHLLLMEDIGDYPDLANRLLMHDLDLRTFSDIGSFLGQLHAYSACYPERAAHVQNCSIQETRLAIQYEQIGTLCKKAGIPDADTLGKQAVKIGHLFLQPGRCLIQGDLWPASIIPTPAGIRIIDWEFAHFGHPAQDVAHLVAHLWMLGHTGVRQTDQVIRTFLDSYLATIDDAMPLLFKDDMLDALAIHFGAEILVRTVGAFQEGYLYDGMTPDAHRIQEAAHFAASHLRQPDLSPLFKF